jgi:glycerol-3-phosphate acyltransferase PlsY
VTLDLTLRVVATLVAAYLLGGIPWALIIGRGFYKIDVREHGSGNLGATNVMRVLGWKAALATLLLDAAKGALAVYLAKLLVPYQPSGPDYQQWAMLVATLASMAGHSFSPYIGFKGGKGVATGAGALLVLVPLAWPILFLTWVLVIALTRLVSLGSVIIAVEYPLLMLWLYYGDWPLLGFAVVAAGLVIWRHSANIGRILRGTEPRISFTRNTTEP